MTNLPSPCPTLEVGKAIGARENVGFVAMWNWIVNFFQSIKNNVVTGINNRTGDVYIVAGKGIDVDVSDKTITISLGDGKTTDDGDDDDEHNGGGAGDEEYSNGNGSGDGSSDGYPPEDAGGGGGGSSGSGGMFEWNENDKTMGPGGCMIGRRWITATGTGTQGDGFFSLKVTIASNGSASCTVVSNASLGQAPTATECWIPIYEVYDGKVTTDYRGAFVVPAYE